MGRKMSEALGCPYFETSSKVNNINQIVKSTVTISPSEILPLLLHEKSKKDAWKQLDLLSLPAPTIKKTKEKPKEKEKKKTTQVHFL